MGCDSNLQSPWRYLPSTTRLMKNGDGFSRPDMCSLYHFFSDCELDLLALVTDWKSAGPAGGMTGAFGWGDAL